MIPLTTMTASQSDADQKSDANPWMGALYAAIFTGVIAFLTTLGIASEKPFLYIPAFLLIGIGPVLGYQLAMGQFAKDWKAILGGLLGFIIPLVSIILWPILVGVMAELQALPIHSDYQFQHRIENNPVSCRRQENMGQNPSWIGTGFAVAMAVWGATIGWFATNA